MNWSHSILGWFSRDFRKLKILSQHLLPQSRVREFLGKQVSEQPRYRAGLIPTEVAVCVGMGPACQTSLLLAFQSGIWATFPPSGTLPYTPSCPAVPGSTLLHSAFMWVGDMLGNVVSRKTCGPLDSRESMQLLGSALPCFRSCNLPWLRLSVRPWDHKPLRRQS